MKDLPLVPSAAPGTAAAGPGVSGWRERRPVWKRERCNFCRDCLLYCPEGALGLEGDELRINLAFCKGCGICAHECPLQALDMVPEYTGQAGFLA
ncbi:4Fe-4S binding protein [Thermanaeromonas sp. C210]|uniref:4Fe-4S binding protein n=1 Tax=Thermanaeromonas sp. C210 TaxID=2731925 RepID=UPI00155D02B0|nr:4Fe-4S binding protein [Thermanaeromonas sp. C210]GFN21846.1 2-oxoacid:acceptor oxidoreductase subunit delta [Thermanaeromonas sp. C210]